MCRRRICRQAPMTRIWLGRRCVSDSMATPGCGALRFQGCGHRVELLQAGVHQVEREADDDGRDHDADDQSDLLQARRGADDVAGLEVLRRVAGIGGRDADDATDGDGQRAKGGGGPALDEEDSSGGHQGGDRHTGDRTGRRAHQADDAGADGDEEKSENDDQERSGKIGRPSYKGSGDRLELKKDEHASDDEQRSR